MLNIASSRAYSVSGILKGHFGLRLRRKNALGIALYCGYVVEVGESIPRALLNGIGTEPKGHAELEDPYYVKEGRNELLGAFVSFLFVESIAQ